LKIFTSSLFEDNSQIKFEFPKKKNPTIILILKQKGQIARLKEEEKNKSKQRIN